MNRLALSMQFWRMITFLNTVSSSVFSARFTAAMSSLLSIGSDLYGVREQ